MGPVTDPICTTRPQPALNRLAEVLNAPYLPLPRADAQRLSAALQAALGD